VEGADGVLRPAKDAPREQHEAYAKENQFFWAPCPRCGKYFGGHEIANGEGGHWWTSPSEGKITCSDCPGNYNIEARDGAGPIRIITIPLFPTTRKDPPS
jgi:hypothetical protein